MALDRNKVLHECRSACLRSIDARDKVFVSTGANGKWYFDWISDNCGTPKMHVGVEYYMEKPEGLSNNISWIANTAGHMPDVESATADILFSGQNIEHLWKKDIIGFLTEAHRIVKPGGMLVLDSPNRDITAAYCISHPEHLIEFTVPEMRELLSAAGFDVTLCKGIFLCRDPRSGTLLPFDTEDADPPFSILERCVLGADAAEQSYIWWIHAVRTLRAPDMARLSTLVDQCWDVAWPERMQRMLSNVGVEVSDEGVATIQCAAGEAGAMLYGPYAPIDPGKYTVMVWMKLLKAVEDNKPVAIADVATGNGDVIVRREVLAKELSTKRYTPISMKFDLEVMNFGFQSRVFSNGAAHIVVQKRSDLQAQS